VRGAEGFEVWNRRIAEAKCSICGEQATGYVEKASLNFEADLSNPFVEMGLTRFDGQIDYAA
jgi:hypothetical protein